MILAHIAGIPVEEWVAPLVFCGGGMAPAVRTLIARVRTHG